MRQEGIRVCFSHDGVRREGRNETSASSSAKRGLSEFVTHRAIAGQRCVTYRKYSTLLPRSRTAISYKAKLEFFNKRKMKVSQS